MVKVIKKKNDIPTVIEWMGRRYILDRKQIIVKEEKRDDKA